MRMALIGSVPTFDAGLEEGRVRKRVHRTERAVAVATDAEPRGADVPLLVQFVDHRRQIHPEVGDVVVVHPLRLADDRRIEVRHRVPERDEILDRSWILVLGWEAVHVLGAEGSVVAGLATSIEPGLDQRAKVISGEAG
jgi:hypothetical protein